MSRTTVMIMAGGKGSRLGPLTCHRAKPAVPFGGRYRIIDFVLSNFMNSGYRHIKVLTQYMASSLIHHLSKGWPMVGPNQSLEVVPAQMRTGEVWYRGTADAVFQNLNMIRDARSTQVAVFGGDHIYKFAIDQMHEEHEDNHADLTIAAFRVPRAQAHQFGVIQVDHTGRITGFQEKPSDPSPMPGDPHTCLVSMGNYFFRADVLEEALEADAKDDNSAHDFGKNVIPGLLAAGMNLYIYDFSENRIPGEPEDREPYWRDVGTIDSYFDANMDLRSPLPMINLYNREWKVRTAQRDYPPVRFVHHGPQGAVDMVDSLVCEGSIVSSSVMKEVVASYDCFLHAGSTVEHSIVLSGCDVGARARMRNVLMDKNSSVGPGAELGMDPDSDRERFPFISPGGIIVLPKGTHVPKTGPIQFAHDMEQLLRNDPATKDAMQAFKDRYVIAARGRHSYDSAGPRYRRFGPGSLSLTDAGG